MSRKTNPLARGITGLAVTREGQLGIGLGGQTLLVVLEPAEMRELATQLLAAAADLEMNGATIANAAIAKAAGRLQ